MFRPALGLIGILILHLIPHSSHAQQAEAPAYKDGDWWRVKVDVVRPPGVSIEGPQLGRLPEYIVKFDSGGPKVIGFEGHESKETNSPSTIALVLGRTGWRGDLSRFKLVGSIPISAQRSSIALARGSIPSRSVGKD
jgi:hypothetical protein